MNIDLPMKAIKLLQEILPILSQAYEEHGSERENSHFAIYFDTEDTINRNGDPEEYKTLNRSTLEKANELKRILNM